MRNEIADTDLLDIPLNNVPAGQLSRAFSVKAAQAEKVREHDAVLQLDELRVAHDKEHELELRDREEALLRDIAERERELVREAQEMDDRTIRLSDGRRVYVDGDNFRDERGHLLEGSDRAEAEVERVTNPNAATWQEKTEIEKRARELKEMQNRVEAMRQGTVSPNDEKTLATYERAIQSKVQTSVARQSGPPDYGSADYIAELTGPATPRSPKLN